jgi:hypothetical protein
MEKLTRRGFLHRTSIGVTASGMLVAAPHLADSSSEPEVSATEQASAGLSEPMLAHVRDAATGELSILIGTREIIYRDAELVARLLKVTQ